MQEIDRAALKFRTVLRLLIRCAYSFADEDGPTRSEQGVMALLAYKIEMTPATLAAIEKVRPQTMGQTLDALDRHGWIKRKADPSDGRQVLISLSASGRRALNKGRKQRQAWLVGRITQLNLEDRRTLIAAIDILDQMVQN
jgi:DNA-binding MarR family transcriptional regulator